MKAKFNSLWWADEAQRAECMRVINVTIENIAQHARWDASIAERVYNKAFDAQQRREAHWHQEKRRTHQLARDRHRAANAMFR